MGMIHHSGLYTQPAATAIVSMMDIVNDSARNPVPDFFDNMAIAFTLAAGSTCVITMDPAFDGGHSILPNITQYPFARVNNNLGAAQQYNFPLPSSRQGQLFLTFDDPNEGSEMQLLCWNGRPQMWTPILAGERIVSQGGATDTFTHSDLGWWPGFWHRTSVLVSGLAGPDTVDISFRLAGTSAHMYQEAAWVGLVNDDVVFAPAGIMVDAVHAEWSNAGGAAALEVRSWSNSNEYYG